MLEPRRIESNVVPNIFDDLRNGNWYYNYDIQSKVVEVYDDAEDTPKSETRYDYIQIKMTGKPDYKRCVEGIIRQYITSSQEFDLINTANKVLLNMSEENEIPTEYIDYLNLLDSIKSKVKKDFKI